MVSALLLVWDGAESIADFDGTLTAALGSPGTRSRPDPVPADLLAGTGDRVPTSDGATGAEDE
jgi:hypothetical protein